MLYRLKLVVPTAALIAFVLFTFEYDVNIFSSDSNKYIFITIDYNDDNNYISIAKAATEHTRKHRAESSLDRCRI